VELKHIKELMTVMSRTGTKRLKLKEGDFELILERPDLSQPSSNFLDQSGGISNDRFYNQMYNRADQTLSRNSEHTSGRMTSSIGHHETKQEDSQSTYITSPMVGTYYEAPSPTDPVFIKVGDRVEKNTVVCIIEAMKVMNEIKANQTGTIAEILVETGQPVEFGAKLFRIVESN